MAAITGFRQRSAAVSVSPHSSRSAGRQGQELGDVAARAEGLAAGPAHDDHAHAVVGLEVAEDAGKLVAHGHGHRVHLGLAVDPERRHRARAARPAGTRSWLRSPCTGRRAAGGAGSCPMPSWGSPSTKTTRRGRLKPARSRALAAVAVEGRRREPGRARHHEGHHPLAPSLVGLADHRHVPHQRVAGEDLLDLHGMDVLAAADDHVVHPPGDHELAVVVDVAHVAREVPAIAQGASVGVRPVPVAGEGLVGVEAGDDLALLAGAAPPRRARPAARALATTTRSAECSARPSRAARLGQERRGGPRTYRSRWSRSG